MPRGIRGAMPDGSPYPAEVRKMLRRGAALSRQLDRAQTSVQEKAAERRVLIRRLRAEGVQYIDIAQAFGVSKTAVRLDQ